MEQFNPNQVVNGVDGECWLDSAKMAEVSECEITIKMNYTDVPLAHKLVKGKKLTGIDQTGKLHILHVSDTIAKKVVDKVKKRKTPTFTLISKVADPDAIGATRVAIYGVKLDEIAILKWARDSIGEDDISFTYEEMELLDYIA